MDNSEDRCIELGGVRVHNLKNITLSIPRGKFIVVTGVSGSGKSSLAFNTLYAEGQRRYVESLSSYARQFLGRLDKPEADYIKGIPPAVAIEQKVTVSNARSTVGTSTEIYDYLRLLFAHAGRTISPVSNRVVSRDTVDDITNAILDFEEGSKVIISAQKSIPEGESRVSVLTTLIEQGFSRVIIDGKVVKIEKAIELDLEGSGSSESLGVVIDRVVVNRERENISRISDSIQSALYEGDGVVIVTHIKSGSDYKEYSYSNKFEADGIKFEEPSVHMFNFNNPIGACPECEGYGSVMGIDEELVIPDSSLSVYEQAVACWRGASMSSWKSMFIRDTAAYNFPLHTPYYKLTSEEKELLWHGAKGVHGIDLFFKHLEKKIYKIQNRVMLSRYRGRAICPTCRGKRLKAEAAYVKVGGYSIDQLTELPISELHTTVNSLELSSREQTIAKRALTEINKRLTLLVDVGLGYLNLNRTSSTLSGGESQRIRLIKSLGSSLVGALYILDEPSIGLHPRDNRQLISILHKLKDQGNSVLVVEHDGEIMKHADQIIDIGPFAGMNGGEVVFQGSYDEIVESDSGLTADYLSGRRGFKMVTKPRHWKNFIAIEGARANNLKFIDVKIPLNIITVVTGVSGSGKSTLINSIFYPAVAQYLGEYGKKPAAHTSVTGDLDLVNSVEYVNQSPIGKSSRSNPATYLKAYDEIRKLFAEQTASTVQGFKASHFSFNIDGGRCPSCKGEGENIVEMQFMADITLKCEDCNGKRFKDDILDVKYRGVNVSDVLEMTINYAIGFFGEDEGSIAKRVVKRLKPLQDVGLGYLRLGQSSSTLSGGENQRVKLASFLSKEKSDPTLFMFDEPTTGLHFHDVEVLLVSFNALIDRGHTVIIIEHNTDVIKQADWIIDLGPEGGVNGGNLLFEGAVKDIVNCKESYTGQILKEELEQI